MSRCGIGCVLVVALLLSASSGHAQGTVTLETVLDRLHRYLAEYAERLPATIATEHYEQKSGGGFSREQVVLESEFGIMRLPNPGGWIGVRDVLRVDGKPIDDHRRKLEELFADPSTPAIQQAKRIALQNARFNIGPIQRTINDPTVVLELLDGRNGSRMRFRKTDEATVDDLHVWKIRFDERRHPTLIQTPDGRDEWVQGTAWVDPATGQLARADATIDGESTRISFFNRTGFTCTVSVLFKDDPNVGFSVPYQMTERYERRSFEILSGQATYTSYRKFTVATRVILPPNP